MNITEKYKVYRKAVVTLNGKIAETTLKKSPLNLAINHLGFEKQGKTVIFDSEFEMDALQDFLMFESFAGEKRSIELYKEEYDLDSELEEEILEALIHAHTSLFTIDRIDKDNSTLWISDVFSGKKNIRLVDIGFSQSAQEGLFLFTRLISFPDFAMSSGVSFLFHPSTEKYVRRRHRKIMKKMKDESDSLKRFVAFFKLSKDCGMEVMNETI